MRPYSPPSNRGRTRAGDDIHHRTADQPRTAARHAAKAARHGARQAARADALSQVHHDAGSPC